MIGLGLWLWPIGTGVDIAGGAGDLSWDDLTALAWDDGTIMAWDS